MDNFDFLQYDICNIFSKLNDMLNIDSSDFPGPEPISIERKHITNLKTKQYVAGMKNNGEKCILCFFIRGKNIMSDIEKRVKDVVVEQLGVDEAEVTNAASFVDDLGADSLDTVELVMALEEEFGTEIPDEEAEKITTVQLAIDYVKANQA